MSLGDCRNPIVRNLARTARPYEEDLILLFNTPSTSGVTPSTTTTTTATTSTTTVGSTSVEPSNKRTKKGSDCKNSRGKHFSKRPKPMFPDSCCESDHENSNLVDSKKYTESCLLQQYNYSVTTSDDLVFVVCSMIRGKHQQNMVETDYQHFGYATYNYDSDQQVFPTHQDSSFVKLLLAQFTGSHHVELSCR